MAITKRLVKGSALTQAELDGNFTDYETFKALFDTTTLTLGNNGKLLFWNNSTSNVEVKTATTSEVTEGTNLYYTDARADARVTAGFASKSTADLSEGANLYYTTTRANTDIDARVTKAFVDALYSGTSAQNSFEVKTSNFNAVASRRYIVDTTSGAVTSTLPASPSAGATIEFTNGAENFATNNLILGANGSTIDGSAGDLTVSSNPTGGMLTAIYDGATWRTR